MSLPKRSAQEIIDTAIRENRTNEYVLYAIAIVFIVLGAGAFIYSLIARQWTLSIASALELALFYPAMKAAQGIRTENQKITLLEISLSNSKTADEAVTALKKDPSRENSAIIRTSSDARTRTEAHRK
jgi:hypothetical protein